MKVIKQVLSVIIVGVIVLGVPQIAGQIAHLFNYDSIDPNRAFMWISVHHIVQAVIILLLMIIIVKFSPLSFNSFGLQVGNKKVGIRYVKIFTLGFLVYALVSIGMVLMFNTFNQFPYPLSFRNAIGQLSFQLFLSGPSEELIFRGFVMTILALFIHRRILNNRFSIVNIIAAIIFVLAHVGFKLSPFELTYDPMQLVYVFVLGVVYGDCFEKTKSVIYPMLLHSISNVISVSLMLFASFIL